MSRVLILSRPQTLSSSYSIPSIRKMSSSRPKPSITGLNPSSSSSTTRIPPGKQNTTAQATSSWAPKKNSSSPPYRPRPPPPSEDLLLLPKPPSLSPVVDTHTHVAITYQMYREKYKEGKHANVYDFVQAMYQNHNIEALVDVWCEAPVQKVWKEFADAAMDEKEKKWGNIQYWFALGVHPHDAKKYNDNVDKDVLEAMKHPRCVALGEIGLDYHYNKSPHPIQQTVFIRQLRHAIRLGKPLVIHTREANDDIERILKAEVPKDHRIHVHCFSDTPELAQKLLDHFPNLYIGITGVATYSSNLNTEAVIRDMVSSSPNPELSLDASQRSKLRILLETDAPFMTPSNLYDDIPALRGKKLPICHSAMIPWTAKFVAEVANEALMATLGTRGLQSFAWNADKVLAVSRENTRKMYGI